MLAMSPLRTSSVHKPLCGLPGGATVCLGPGEGIVGGADPRRRARGVAESDKDREFPVEIREHPTYSDSPLSMMSPNEPPKISDLMVQVGRVYYVRSALMNNVPHTVDSQDSRCDAEF